jgi:trehalose 6-phosphate synthase/phosphatase
MNGSVAERDAAVRVRNAGAGLLPCLFVTRGSPSEAEATAKPIVVVSNRLPFTFQRTAKGLERRPSSGGLVSALDPVLRRRGGTWIGWPGLELRPGERVDSQRRPYRVAAVPLSEAEATRHYGGFSNRTLWPLFHSLPVLSRFDRRDWETYQEVNARFARIASEHADGADLVWMHDYHLMRAPEQLRLMRPDVRSAFFLHIPFPSWDVFRVCPWERELLRGLLGSDLIGFHVEGYANNFLDCVERSLGARVDRTRMMVEHGDRIVKVGYFPIGIEFAVYEKEAMEAPEHDHGPRERLVLGVDRLDYTKGIPERISAFERLLELYPEHREKVVFLQLTVPSRSQVAEYRELKREVDELVGRVNGRFATARWSPIRYLYRSLPRKRLCGLYRDADVALITPIRDGMNLVAKEYVTCQVRDPGVLILSRLAGAAETMREALQVNPFDVDGTARAIHRALSMDEEERASRIASLRRRERRDDVEAWVNGFLGAAAEHPLSLAPLTDAEIESWLTRFIRSYPLCIFLDYDGTLTPLAEHPSKARLSQGMREAVQSVAERDDTTVAIVSGRSLEDVRRTVGDGRLIFAGNHGLEIEGPGLGLFRHEDLDHYAERSDELAAELGRLESGGAWTEHKGPTLTFHFRRVPEEKRDELAEAARQLITSHGYQARDAHMAVEARPPIGWDKGRAVLHVLRARWGPDWSEKVRVIYVGDDQTDEDAFRFLAGLASTFRVGSAETPTAAARRLANVDAVQKLLEWIARRPATQPQPRSQRRAQASGGSGA